MCTGWMRHLLGSDIVFTLTVLQLDLLMLN